MSRVRLSGLGYTALAVFLMATDAHHARGQEKASIKYVNGLDEAVSLYFQPEGLPEFLRPPVDLGPRKEKTVPLSVEHKGKRYVVVRDEGARDTRVGWVDLEAIARSRNPLMLIDGVYVTETRQEKYTVAIPVCEMVTGPDRRLRRVTTYVMQERTRTVVVRVRKPLLKIAVNGRWENLRVEAL
jgi:hypothetical protein